MLKRHDKFGQLLPSTFRSCRSGPCTTSGSRLASTRRKSICHGAVTPTARTLPSNAPASCLHLEIPVSFCSQPDRAAVTPSGRLSKIFVVDTRNRCCSVSWQRTGVKRGGTAMSVVSALSLALLVGFIATGLVGFVGWRQRMREGSRFSVDQPRLSRSTR